MSALKRITAMSLKVQRNCNLDKLAEGFGLLLHTEHFTFLYILSKWTSSLTQTTDFNSVQILRPLLCCSYVDEKEKKKNSNIQCIKKNLEETTDCFFLFSLIVGKSN